MIFIRLLLVALFLTCGAATATHARDTALDEVAQQPVYKTTPPANKRYADIIRGRIERMYTYHKPAFDKAYDLCLAEYYPADECAYGRTNAELAFLDARSFQQAGTPMERFKTCIKWEETTPQIATPSACGTLYIRYADANLQAHVKASSLWFTRSKLKAAKESCVRDGFGEATCQNVYETAYEKANSIFLEIIEIIIFLLMISITLALLYSTRYIFKK